MKSCPPCHGECDQGRRCPAESHPAYEAWADWFIKLKTDIAASRYMFARSSYGRAFRAGWDASTKQKDKDLWKTSTNDQA